VAAVLGFAVSLAAQSPTTTTAPQSSPSDRKAGEIAVSGCLAKSPLGGYMLTNARIDPAGSASSTTTAGTTTAGTSGTTTAGTAGSTTTEPAGSGSAASAMGSTWFLSGGTDLDKHVGHKIQVTGIAAKPSDTTTGTSGTTTTAGAAETAASQQKLDVQSVKMISSSCS
jgi:hypothetical protein